MIDKLGLFGLGEYDQLLGYDEIEILTKGENNYASAN